MKTIPAKQAKDQFGSLLEAAQREPVTITKQGRPAAVVISLDEYERMGGERARLKRVVSDLRQEAKENGLTEEIVQAIIDER